MIQLRASRHYSGVSEFSERLVADGSRGRAGLTSRSVIRSSDRSGTSSRPIDRFSALQGDVHEVVFV
jgi:hypothetical protein